MCKDVYAVILCSALGEVCHTSITYENEAIYVNFKIFCCSCSPNHFMLLFSICNYTWTTITNRTTTTKTMRIKMSHINYRAYMP